MDVLLWNGVDNKLNDLFLDYDGTDEISHFISKNAKKLMLKFARSMERYINYYR